MASSPDILRFQLPGHEEAALRSMNQLRSEERFCDVTVLSDGLKFRGHRVVLAACSPFLRDQFLLNPGSELQVSMMHGPRVVSDLLLSCYTGLLEFSVRDIVNYLTAASYLQMEHVVEKCRQALTQFIEPKIGLRGPNKVMSSRAPTTTMRPMHPFEKSRPRKAEARPAMESEEEMLLMPEEDECEDEEEEEGSSSDICIVKVEAGMGGGKGARSWGKAAEEQSSLAQQEEALVNSTVEGGEPGDGNGQQSGILKAIYSDEVEGGEGVLIIPSSYHEEEEEVLDGGTGGCQSSVLVDGGSRSALGGLGGTSCSVIIGDARFGNRQSVRCCKCDEVFQGVEKLVFHMRAQHFVFMCPRCGKQFNHSSNLNRHMNVHRGVKSHTCHLCGKCFTQKSTLHDHLNLHSGERPYRCSYCDVRFAHKPAIRRHLKEQHGKTTAQNVLEAGMAEINVVVG
ncbi:zinc finger and BTB domain-containing protein 12 [Spea bombifrons]|uniref:zinc finger and BTB domain-containing protein 12 n=1 Tax=Spea bombifrons TaxID=233779 RepID=UPI00234ABF02|nr:zinc finger and BTB domain-containing protein 12 [Spea bombifrons]